MENKKNRGSASIFMICLLIPTIICMCTLIKYAQMISAKGMVADATGLAENAVIGSYNHPIMDAYGLFCYTKSEQQMTEIANICMENSLPGNINCHITASYSNAKNLNDNTVFIYMIKKYMRRWNKVAGLIGTERSYDYINMTTGVFNIYTRIENNWNNAVKSGTVYELEFTEELEANRRNAIGNTYPDRMKLKINSDNMNYAGANDIISAENMLVSYNNSIGENILAGEKMLQDVINYYQPLEMAVQSQIAQNDKYFMALYAYNVFSMFKRYGSTSLTGNHFDSGEVVSVSPWAENEFLINGNNESTTNCNKIKYLIYESLFAEYMVGMYDLLNTDVSVIEYATLVAGDNTELIPVLKDEIIIGMCSKLAYDQLCSIYGSRAKNTIITSYQQYIQLFNMIEIERNSDAYIERMKHVITINAKNSPSTEAGEFDFATAWTDVEISAQKADIKTSFK